VKQEILTIFFFVLITLYLSGFLFAVRLVLNSTQTGIAKAVEILGLFFFVAVLCVVTLLVVVFSNNPWAH